MSKRALFFNYMTVYPVLADLLARDGYGVEVVPDAGKGLARLDARAYDVVIVRESPGNESWKLCEKIREVSAAPLIVVSANASTESSVRAINAGADYFMRKPFGPLEFLARVNSLRQRRVAGQPLTVSP
ncbi:MAG: hypothetical protein A2Z05_04890 [Chloroflexi bacterium RBG_16_60_22]|nr:MAG: hypothetical protein A2Z05_04890 [Chloroflexi bacterium RBG_16_60_22]